MRRQGAARTCVPGDAATDRTGGGPAGADPTLHVRLCCLPRGKGLVLVSGVAFDLALAVGPSVVHSGGPSVSHCVILHALADGDEATSIERLGHA